MGILAVWHEKLRTKTQHLTRQSIGIAQKHAAPFFTFGIKTMGGNLKSTVYIETSIISYLTARQNNDLRSMANKSATIEWWETQKSKFELVVSEFVIAEAGLGHP